MMYMCVYDVNVCICVCVCAYVCPLVSWPPLRHDQESYGWRGALFILSAVNLNCAVCGALMRPLPRMPRSCDGVPEMQVTSSPFTSPGGQNGGTAEEQASISQKRVEDEEDKVKLLLNNQPYEHR